MRRLEELIDAGDPALPRLGALVEGSPHRVDVLLPGEGAADCLRALGITTRSMLGAIAYQTGGVMIADGWLRVLGGGSAQLPRRLDLWNGLGGERRHAGGLLVADDAGGGFFAWQDATRTVAYLAPDTLVWEDTGLGYENWLKAMLGPELLGFYEGLRWDGWRFLATELTTSQSMFFHPPRFTAEGSDPMKCYRGLIPVDECWDVQLDLARQLAEARA
ncbi:MAG: DUF2625 family protein [Myxococcota bacterium]|nr:DUF2625 family protein [Myxococcota bacterium]